MRVLRTTALIKEASTHIVVRHQELDSADNKLEELFFHVGYIEKERFSTLEYQHSTACACAFCIANQDRPMHAS
jgi:hypothetical protein